MLKNSLIGFLLASVVLDSAAALPPKYLEVKDFRRCLATQQIGSYRAWCIPAAKPESCPATSWDQLQALGGKDQVPDCPARSDLAAPPSAVKPSESKASE